MSARVENDASGSSGIGIVVVALNARAALETTIRSVVELDDPRVTLYVVDGASTDGTVDYLRSLEFSSVRWLSEPDKGIYDAMNKGWAMVPTSDYVLYLGAGDKPYALPTPAVLRSAEERCINIVIGECFIGDSPIPSHWNAELMRRNTAHHQAMMVRRAVHPAPPFDATMRIYADWEFSLRLFLRGERALHDKDFRSYALPGGASARVDLAEIWRVCCRHVGLLRSLRAWRLNWRYKRSLSKPA